MRLSVSKPVCWILRQSGPMLSRLHLEEAMARQDKRNFLVLGQGFPEVSIIMGISGKPEKLMDVEAVRAREDVAVIKRFTGGGTVVTDENSLFAGVICNKDVLGPDFQPFPRPIMKWTEGIYEHCFGKAQRAPATFSLREHDYVFGEKKFGGNAQLVAKSRFVHHTSFLWDYRDENMKLLTIPESQPDYRAGRDHGEFVCKLKSIFDSKEQVFDGILAAWSHVFDLREISEDEVMPLLSQYKDEFRTKVVQV